VETRRVERDAEHTVIGSVGLEPGKRVVGIAHRGSDLVMTVVGHDATPFLFEPVASGRSGYVPCRTSSPGAPADVTDRGGAVTTIYYESDADPGALDGQQIAVVGYGNQGRSWALNLRDSGRAPVVCVRRDDT